MSSAGNIQTDIVTHGLPIIMFMLMLTNTNAEIMMMIIMMMMMMVQQFKFQEIVFSGQFFLLFITVIDQHI